MNRFYRVLIALSSVLPMFVSLAFVFSGEAAAVLSLAPTLSFQFCFTALVLFFCFLITILVKKALIAFACKKNLENILMTSCRELGSSSLMEYLPYVLPLFIVQGQSQNVAGWVIGLVMLFLLAYSSEVISFNPFLKLAGVDFFEVTLQDKRVITLLTLDRQCIVKSSNPCCRVAKIADFCYVLEECE